MQLGGNQLVLQRCNDLDDACHPRCALGVANIRLHRANYARATIGLHMAIHIGQRLELDRVAKRSAGAVCLDICHLRSLHTSISQRIPGHLLLRKPVWSRQASAAAILIHGSATNQRQNPVAIGQRVRHTLEHQHATTIAAHEAVRRSIECLAAAISRHHAIFRERDGYLRRHDQIHAAGQRQIAFARAQALHRQVQSDQRGRARRVDCDARPFQIEHIRQAIRRNTVRTPSAGVGVDPLDVRKRNLVIVVGADTQKHPGLAASELLARKPGVLECLPGNLQQQPLLRIHPHRLAGRNAKELRVEIEDIFEAASPARTHFTRRRRVGIVQRMHIPAVGRHLSDGIDAIMKQIPERLGCMRPGGKAAAHANDRDRLVLGLFDGGEFRLRVAERKIRCL